VAGIGFNIRATPVLPDEIYLSYTNIGENINRLSESFSWLPAIHNSSDGNVDQIWILETLIAFLRSDKDVLLLLDSCIYIPSGFEQMVMQIHETLGGQGNLVNLFPSKTKVIDTDQHQDTHLTPVSELTRTHPLCWMLDRKFAERLISIIERSHFIHLNDSVIACNLSVWTISENHPARAWVYVEVYQSSLSVKTNNFKVETSIEKETFSQVNNDSTKVSAFISHWYATWSKIDSLESSLKNRIEQVVVLNTTKFRIVKWENDIPISFFRQFQFAVENFDPSNDFMLFVTADVDSPIMDAVIENSLKVLNTDFVGTYSPLATYDAFQLDKEYILSPSYDLKALPVVFNDLLFTYIHRDVIEVMKKFFNFFENHDDTFNPEVGHTIAPIVNSVVFDLGLYNIRDARLWVRHPNGSSYDRSAAMQESILLESIASDFFEKYYNHGFTNKYHEFRRATVNQSLISFLSAIF